MQTIETPICLNDITGIIKDCEYIRNCKANKKKDKDSFSFLVDAIVLSQSDCIKLGTGFEKLISDTILRFRPELISIKPKNAKGKKEKDHLFLDKGNKIVYYAELKANLNLDTEKSKSTYIKCLQIAEELRNEFDEYEIRWCLLGYRYTEQSEMSKVIISKYDAIRSNVFGINEYFEMMGIQFKFGGDDYKTYVNNVAIEMFSD